jgi:serine/threonine protein kinase
VGAEKSWTVRRGTLVGGAYRIVEKRAAGGMGEVYRASHVRWPGWFAIKVLSRRRQRDTLALARFGQEAEMLASVQHANVVRLIEFDTTRPEAAYLAMEYLEGVDLAQHIAEHGPATPRRAAVLVTQIAAALEAAHVRRIVHADIKPGNVMLMNGPGDNAKVLDFGVAHFVGQPPSLGTPAYMAPEQAEGRAEAIDSRADQFALAALSYVLLTGEDPFPGDQTQEVLARIVHERPLVLAGLVPWPAREVDAVLARAFSRRPADRYCRVSEFAAEFARAMAIVGEEPGQRIGTRLDRGAQRPLLSAQISRTLLREQRGARDSDLVAAARLGCRSARVARTRRGGTLVT